MGMSAPAMAVVLQVLSLLAAPPDPQEVFCLAQNVFWEARNQDTDGREAVAHVTINRVEARRWPSTICEVVWQHRQFSWTHDGKSDKIPPIRVEDGLWHEMVVVAVRAMLDLSDDPVGGSTHYHAVYVEPVWRHELEHVVLIGAHQFYR